MKKILISDGNVVVRAVLNDTVAAKDFEKRLPFRCSGYDSGIDYCCTAASGVYDPTETQVGWKNGDISLGGGWFALLYGGEEQSKNYANMMIIGHIDEEDLSIVKEMSSKVNLIVSFEE
ncbi:cyclophilin-like fold protein [Clostridium sp.]|uniref:cyclophilin-like fold protein n=1 Tax=Clostridium sp. TaxID=1506 RepID=UPI0035A0FC04